MVFVSTTIWSKQMRSGMYSPTLTFYTGPRIVAVVGRRSAASQTQPPTHFRKPFRVGRGLRRLRLPWHSRRCGGLLLSGVARFDCSLFECPSLKNREWTRINANENKGIVFVSIGVHSRFLSSFFSFSIRFNSSIDCSKCSSTGLGSEACCCR